MGAMHGAEPRIVESKLCSPRGVKSAYVLQGVAESPGGTKKEIRAQYKVTSLTLLRELETVDRKKMTAVCAKNNLSYMKRAIACFIPGRRAEQLERGREQQKAARRGRAERARAELACVAAVVGM